MIVYIDSNYLCHLETDDTMRPVEIPFFDDKCKTFIEGYRYIPNGETWTREDGVIFPGHMSPAVDYNSLIAAQQQYEEDKKQMEDMQTALDILGVSP